MNGAIMHTGYVTFLDLIFSTVGGLQQPMFPYSGMLEFFPLNQNGLNTGFYSVIVFKIQEYTNENTQEGEHGHI